MLYNVNIDGTEYRLDLGRAAGGWHCRVNGRELRMDAVRAQPEVLSVLIDGRAYEIRREQAVDGTRIWVGDRPYTAEVRDSRSPRGRRLHADVSKGAKQLVAPMPGKVIRLLLRENSPVEAGQGVVVVEAMKMQNEIRSPKKGTLRKLAVVEGAAVNAGDVLAVVE
jgi:biotin carboxyl carrier protein